MKLHIGCGENILEDWYNGDIYPQSEQVQYFDATKRFPFSDETVTHIFSEHMIEHIELDYARHMLGECFRVMVPGGLIRIATPSLDFLAELIQGMHPDYVEWASAAFFPEEPSSIALVVNNLARGFGHKFIYDDVTLRQLLRNAGFIKTWTASISRSDDEELRGLENIGRVPRDFLALETLVIEGQK